jgi:hypothetical protein
LVSSLTEQLLHPLPRGGRNLVAAVEDLAYRRLRYAGLGRDGCDGHPGTGTRTVGGRPGGSRTRLFHGHGLLIKRHGVPKLSDSLVESGYRVASR